MGEDGGLLLMLLLHKGVMLDHIALTCIHVYTVLGRTLFGAAPAKAQQLEDQYFGTCLVAV